MPVRGTARAQQTDKHLTASFQEQPGKPAPDGKNVMDFHDARNDLVAVASARPYANICTSLQIDNPASTSVFYKSDAPSVAEPTVSKH